MLNILEHPVWENTTHIAVVLLYIYVFYLIAKSTAEINVPNLLLIIIALSIGVLIHQNINLRNGAYIPADVIKQLEEERKAALRNRSN